MLHLEFAVAPSEIRSIEQLSLLGARLGFEKGAVLSGFPKKWYGDVLRQAGDLNDIAGKKFAEQLKLFKERKIVSFSRKFEGESWAAAARESHQQRPFHRIVEQTFNQEPVYLSSLIDLDDDDFQYTASFPRDAASLAGAAQALLMSAEKVTLYDPYICVSRESYRKTLFAMMSLCTKAEVEFHIFSEEDNKPDWPIREQALEQFAAQLPPSIKLHWYCVDDQGSGFLHPRGLFTAKGGLVYDRGFEEPYDVERRATNTDIAPMNLSQLQEKSVAYGTSGQYEYFTLIRVWHSHL